MSPIRREGNEVTPIQSWDTWLDKTIEEAQRQGAFDDVPGKGKPLPSRDNPYGADWDSAFSILKNAHMAPYWIELDKEIRADAAALEQQLQRTSRHLAAHLADIQAAQTKRPHLARPVGNQEERPARPRWRPFRRGRAKTPALDAARPRASPAALEAARQRARAEYLERAARLDKKIVESHNSLPRDLWWLQRPRLTAGQAAREFDAACPPVGSAAWAAIIAGCKEVEPSKDSV